VSAALPHVLMEISSVCFAVCALAPSFFFSIPAAKIANTDAPKLEQALDNSVLHPITKGGHQQQQQGQGKMMQGQDSSAAGRRNGSMAEAASQFGRFAQWQRKKCCSHWSRLLALVCVMLRF
jgi:hypothetical protein